MMILQEIGILWGYLGHIGSFSYYSDNYSVSLMVNSRSCIRSTENRNWRLKLQNYAILSAKYRFWIKLSDNQIHDSAPKIETNNRDTNPHRLFHSLGH
jgi:hypothetical protein